MPTTAWRFPGTEGADSAVVRLKELKSKDLINLMDIAVLRWPEYAEQPTTVEHAHEQRQQGLVFGPPSAAPGDRRFHDHER